MNVSRRTLLLGGAACVCSGVVGAVIGRETASEPDPEPTGSTGTSLLETNTVADRLGAQPDGIFHVHTTEPVVAMTFDDGPDPAYTPYVLDVLDRFDAKATFFCIGVNALARRQLLATQMAKGHSIGNHTHDHADLEALTPEAVRVEIDGGETALVDSGAPKPDLFRPPKGDTDQVVGVLADADRYKTIFWTVCVEHFVLHQDMKVGVQQLLSWVRPGSIVLAHDGGHIAYPDRPDVDRTKTMEALPLVLEGLKAKGLNIVDMPALLQARAGPEERRLRR
jgi:chitooligosaccharide deacetylase